MAISLKFQRLRTQTNSCLPVLRVSSSVMFKWTTKEQPLWWIKLNLTSLGKTSSRPSRSRMTRSLPALTKIIRCTSLTERQKVLYKRLITFSKKIILCACGWYLGLTLKTCHSSSLETRKEYTLSMWQMDFLSKHSPLSISRCPTRKPC